MFIPMQQLLAPAMRHPLYGVLACALVMNTLAWQGVSAHSAQQDQPASFTLKPAKGNCSSVTGNGAHFPPGSTVNIEGPSINGREVSPPGENVQVEARVAADGTFTVTFKPCPRQVVTGAGTFPVAEGDQYMFTADNPLDEPNGTGAAAIYTVSGLGNAKLPTAGASTNGIILLFVGVALAAIGWCLLLFERTQQQEP